MNLIRYSLLTGWANSIIPLASYGGIKFMLFVHMSLFLMKYS